MDMLRTQVGWNGVRDYKMVILPVVFQADLRMDLQQELGWIGDKEVVKLIELGINKYASSLFDEERIQYEIGEDSCRDSEMEELSTMFALPVGHTSFHLLSS